MVVDRPELMMGNLIVLKRNIMIAIVLITVVMVVIVFLQISYFIVRIKRADLSRSKAFRDLQHTSKLASIGRLAAGVAHEINNPLAIINEKAGLMKDLVLSEKNLPNREKYVSQIDSITSSIDRCGAITHRLLGFARRMEVGHEKICMDSLIEEVLGFLGKEAVHRNINIRFHYPEDIPVIESDRAQLQQVFLNIINNSFEAVNDGGCIDIGMRIINDGVAEVSIHDNGHGIEQKDLEQIFDPFFTTKKKFGTGLGLSITYGIVRKLGGDIHVESVIGEGTTFIITLPMTKK